MNVETTVRDRLGIPAGAPEALVIAESTHWDPDWLLTSTEYLRAMVAPTLDAALDALDAEPRRVYSVECAFYPEAYLALRPQERGRFVTFAEQGRLRFTGGGVTTPDTLIPSEEMLLRDLLEGSRWLRGIGITAEPRSLYLPDSFGHSPGLPALCAAAGVPYAAICRIDGMRFPGAELESASRFPWPGTSAALLTEAGTSDFIWRSPDGSEVLTHWHAFGYGHGDMIGHAGFTRAMGLPLAWPSREPAKVAARIETYLSQLRPLSATPYHLLAIGFDFSRPVRRLIELIDTWNTHHYERTGVWLVNAALDDYLDLVATHRDALPVLELDPNPYWTGFYATRPALKRSCADLGAELVALDAARVRRHVTDADRDPTTPDTNALGMNALGTNAPDTDAARRPVEPAPGDDRADRARWIAATSNHHDLVTGTSPDRTARREQWPWLLAAHDEVAAASRRAGFPTVVDGPTQASHPAAASHQQRSGHLVTVTTAEFTAVLDESRGGTLASLTDAAGCQLVNPGTLSCVAIAERGGLWRMGYEFPGGRWRPQDATVDHPGTVTATPTASGATILIEATLGGRPVRLGVELDDATASILVTTAVTPRLPRTVTLAWRGTALAGGLTMHQPGTVVQRPLARRYEPTFWPLHSWAVTTRPAATSGDPNHSGVATATPTALRALESGTLEVVVARTAPRELAWGVVPLLGPAMGHERGCQVAHLAFGAHDPATPFHRTGRRLFDAAERAAGRRRPAWPVICDDPDIEILTIKPADRGAGVIVRFCDWEAGASSRQVRLRPATDVGATVVAARRCDSLERDMADLDVVDGAAVIDTGPRITTTRLTFRTASPTPRSPADGRGR